MSRRRWPSVALGLFAWTVAILLGAAWWSGATAWADGPRKLATPLEEIPAVENGPIRVAVIGDIQNGLSEFTDLLALTADLQPDLILQLGDTVNNALPGRYAALHSVFRDYGPDVPVLSVPGNHDLHRETDTLDHYDDWIGPRHWRVDVRGWRLIGLDNAAGPLTKPSVALMRDSASDPAQRGVIVAAHRPIDEPLPSAPTVQFAGHVHRSQSFDDDAGTRHYHHGNNCDRSHDDTDENLPTVGILTLDDAGFRWETHTIPRDIKLGIEFRRLAVGSVYPWMRGRPLVGGLALALLVLAGFAVLRRRAGIDVPLASGAPPEAAGGRRG